MERRHIHSNTHTKNVSMITHILNSKCVYHTQFVFRWLAVILFFCSPEYIQAYSMWLKQMQCALKQEYVLFAQFIPNIFVSARSTHYAIKNKARQGYNTASVVRLVFSQWYDIVCLFSLRTSDSVVRHVSHHIKHMATYLLGRCKGDYVRWAAQ